MSITDRNERTCSAAIAYGDLGWYVLPLYSVNKSGRCGCGNSECKSPGKHPHRRFAPNGLKNATRDGFLIASWFAKGISLNVGIRTGTESGIVVLDVDIKNNGQESLKWFGEIPTTPKVQTGGGGWHHFFTHPGGIIKNSAEKIAPGLDIRGDGGYVVGAPSLHVSGREYAWLIDATAPLADIPLWLTNELNKATSKDLDKTAAKVSIPETINEGKRNDTLTILAGKLRRIGLNANGIYAALRQENKRQCRPPLDEEELKRIAKSIASHLPGDVPPDAEPVLLDLNTIETKETVWFWDNRIPKGKLSLIAGNPGCGKSFLTAWIAAHVTTGESWPDTNQEVEVGTVIFLAAEDGVADVIRPRIEWHDGDVSMVKILSGVITNCDEGQQHFSLEKHVMALEKAIKTTDDLRLIIFDPISAYFGGIDSHKQVAVVSALAPVAELAERYDVTIIAVAHLNKSIDAAAVYRVLGSMGFVTAPRAVWLVSLDPNDDSKRRRLLTPCKCNLSIYPTTLAFTIEPNAETQSGKIVFDPTPMNMSADDALIMCVPGCSVPALT